MGMMNLLTIPDINQGVREWSELPGALLLDVRAQQEYREGHIPGSLNIPLHRLEDVEEAAEDRNIPLFVYCRSGRRSRQAAIELERMGYSDVRNIGGIELYTGRTEE